MKMTSDFQSKRGIMACTAFYLFVCFFILFILSGCNSNRLTPEPLPPSETTEPSSTQPLPPLPSSPPTTAPPQVEQTIPFMWLITSPTGQTMYMLGSIHAATPDLYPLHPEIMRAFHASNHLALEIHRDNPAATGMGGAWIYTDGRTLADDLPPELHQRLSVVLTENESAGVHKNIRSNELFRFESVVYALKM